MTTGWFQRATAVFGRPEPIPQRFDVACDCGARLQGERLPEADKPSCRTCGTPVFILPATTYPIPPSQRDRLTGTAASTAAPSQTPTRKPFSKKRSRSETESDGDTRTSERDANRNSKSDKRGNDRSDGSRASGRRTDSRSDWATPTPQRSVFTPLRLVAAAIAVGCLLTMVVIYRQVSWDRAQRDLQAALDRAAAAINEQQFENAAAEYRTAVVALGVLGRKDAAAQEIRQRQREVTVAAQRHPQPFAGLLEEWLAGRRPRPELAQLAGDGWHLFDVWLIPAPPSDDSAARGSVQLDLPLIVNETPVDVYLPVTPAVRKHLTTGVEPTRRIFAAQIERGELPTQERPAAQVWLKPQSVVWWSDAELLTMLGMTTPDQETELQPLLDRQHESSESSP